MANEVHYAGPGFCSMLTLIFITLKLTGFIGWSWWWVWSPLLISTGFWLIFFLFAIVIAALMS